MKVNFFFLNFDFFNFINGPIIQKNVSILILICGILAVYFCTSPSVFFLYSHSNYSLLMLNDLKYFDLLKRFTTWH